MPRQNKRRSYQIGLRHEYGSCDSETDMFVSDQEDELVNLLDYSSQEDDVSPSVFYDNCEEIISYIERTMKKPPKVTVKDDDLNERYNIAARNSLIDMDWRILKYGENIFLGEVKKLVDLFVEVFDRFDNKRKREKILHLKANDDLENEMKRLSQVIEDLDSEMETDDAHKEVTTSTIRTIQTNIPAKKLKLEERNQKSKLKHPVFKVKKVRPVNLVINLDISNDKVPEIKSMELEKKSPITKPEEKFPEQTQKGEATPVIVQPDVITKETSKTEFWKMFTDDSEWWTAIAKRNLQKMDETRKELARFSGHELVLADYQYEMEKYNKEKETLQSFIDEVDKSKSVNKDLEYDKKYEDMVLKLIEFAKKDFIYKGFDPLIEQLKTLSNIEIEPRRKKVVNIQDIINIYSQIDITNYSYEELCLLEKYYKEIIRKYKKETVDKENIMHRDEDRSPSLVRETKSASPSYHRNVILNVQSKENSIKNVNEYRHSVTFGGSLNRSKSKKHKSQNSTEIIDLTRTYPIEYYANNWWSIYEDILKSRENQYGSIDNWWRFYEAVLNKESTDDEQLNRIRAVVEYRNSLRSSRPNSRMEEQLRMLDEIKNDRFRETEDVITHDNNSVRYFLQRIF